ncbi:MAG: phytanoyl-CoA dioxygenase family protein [Gammaproteobacteria bacterium]|nr:phytanoyl-CoA dioxygenase family protein [Gammaproteobacteria bacterium]
MDETQELQRYLYDLQGYLVIEDVLSAETVRELNALIDAQNLPPPPRVPRFGNAGGSAPTGPGFLEWGKPFCDLIDHPLAMDLLRMQLGDCFRLDRLFGIYMRKGQEGGVMHSDYGASQPYSEAEHGRYFPQPAYQALHGFSVIVWNLTDAGPQTGGLRVIPGSHNSHYRLPTQIREERFSEVLVSPAAPAGSVTIFSEATTHGTGAWTADHERRSILYKYCASPLTWSETRVTAPSNTELTQRQAQLLQGPAGAKWFFPTLFPESTAESAAAS